MTHSTQNRSFRRRSSQPPFGIAPTQLSHWQNKNKKWYLVIKVLRQEKGYDN